MDNEDIIETSDRELKAVLTKYGVKDSDLPFCTMEILMVMLKVINRVENEVERLAS
jgi:hypothetical protein